MSDARFTRPPMWLIVDGNNQVVTDAYGAGVMSAAATFTRRMQTLIDLWQPACVVTCWDAEHSWRRSMHREYKAGRIKMPGIENAIAAAQDAMRSIGVGVLSVDEFEADDLIATLVEHARADQCRAVMMSQDKDLHQCLVEGEVTQLLKATRERTKESRGARLVAHWRSTKDFRAQYGIEPSQWVDYQCLVGQPSDNIRGVKQIGGERAAQILKACGSLEGFFANPFKPALTQHQRASIINDRRYLLQIARPLCTLRRDVPLPEMWREAV